MDAAYNKSLAISKRSRSHIYLFLFLLLLFFNFFKFRAVFLGTYTQSEMDAAYNKSRAMFVSGIVLCVLGGIFLLALIGYALYSSYKIDIDMWLLMRKVRT
jgi:hypothetical protein